VLRAVADRAGTWLLHPAPVVQELKVPVRLTPPALSVTSAQHYVAQGGAEAVVYRVGASSVRDGVRAGEWFFPGYPLPGAPRGPHGPLSQSPTTSPTARAHASWRRTTWTTGRR